MKRLIACLVMVMLFIGFGKVAAAADIICWFAPEWKENSAAAKKITDTLSEKSGLVIKLQIADKYPQILDAFSAGDPCLVYAGSFVQSIIHGRGNGVPLVQAINGKEYYGALMLHPKGKSPKEILKNTPAAIAFAVGTSSGESAAKAVTGGKAAVKEADHAAAANAVKAGTAKAAFVKDHWWNSNKEKFPELEAYQVPGVSESRNPDNVLTASKTIQASVQARITEAALASPQAFGASKMSQFNKNSLVFSVELMKKAGIDPFKYTW
ncbi:MAG: hypothetical protein A2511_15850 [Deltaproteobacteria bacterium RIFOXYD12_FULL_50_9]|nr:MAG: hypothetical protein A2511_15850 [Deltaproteobacteria bacterium RIFOXYD12_FULL_50_9]